MTPTNSLNDWSSGYYITEEPVRVVGWTGDYPVMSYELVDELTYDDEPLVVKFGGKHYYPHCETSVPTDVIAIPDNQDEFTEDNVLVAKPDTVDMYFNGILE